MENNNVQQNAAVTFDAPAPAAQTAPAAQGSSMTVYNYDLAYAKEKKVKKGTGLMLVGIFGLIGSLLLMAFGSEFIPESADWAYILFLLLLYVMIALLIAAAVRTERHQKAATTAFVEDKNTLWCIRMQPRVNYAGAILGGALGGAVGGALAAASYGTSRSVHNNITDEELLFELVRKAKNGEKIKKNNSFGMVYITAMHDAKLKKPGKMMKVTYKNAKGRSKKMNIPDVYPDLPELLSK